MTYHAFKLGKFATGSRSRLIDSFIGNRTEFAQRNTTSSTDVNITGPLYFLILKLGGAVL